MINRIRLLIMLNAMGLAISGVAIAQDTDPGDGQRSEVGAGTVAPDSPEEISLSQPENTEGPVTPDNQTANPSNQLENTAKACLDKKDNDDDQLVDCADPDCSYIVFCSRFPIAPFSPQTIELTLDNQPHVRGAIIAAHVFNLASYLAPLSALAVSDFSNAAGLAVMISGPSSDLLSAILSSSAMSIWHHKVVSAGYRVPSSFKVGSWMLTSLVIGANIAWWVMMGLAINGENSVGLSMSMIGVAIGTPLINTIKLLAVDRRWENRLQSTVTGASTSR